MKLKEFGPLGALIPCTPLDLPMFPILIVHDYLISYTGSVCLHKFPHRAKLENVSKFKQISIPTKMYQEFASYVTWVQKLVHLGETPKSYKYVQKLQNIFCSSTPIDTAEKKH